MPRLPDSGQIDLAEVFTRIQSQLLAQLSLGDLIEHPSTHGTSTEQLWLTLLSRFLPRRFHAAPAFVINAQGRRSRQIDIVISDALHTTPLFPDSTADHIPIESVYAVFEVKPSISRQWLDDASLKAASVRALSPRPIPAGLLAATSVWSPQTFSRNVRSALSRTPAAQQINFGCALSHGAFDYHKKTITTAPSTRALIFFLLRLIDHLNATRPLRRPPLRDYLNAA